VNTEKHSRDGTPYRWASPDGVMHAAEGNQLVPFDPGTFVLWTACGQYDVPANRGFASHDKITCVQCAAAQS
jgi:hypothetical protein